MHGAGLDVLPSLLQRFAREPATHIPTSQLLRAMLADASPHRVSLTWLLDNLRQRSFGAILLVLGFTAMLPGLSVTAGAALLVFGCQMMRLMGRVIPLIATLEKFVHPRWPMPYRITQRLAGGVVLLLAVSLFLPVPLSNVIPGALTMVVALAYLEEDGVLLSAALGLAFAVTAVEGWAVLKGANFLLHL
jgi:hypothetical protein